MDYFLLKFNEKMPEESQEDVLIVQPIIFSLLIEFERNGAGFP